MSYNAFKVVRLFGVVLFLGNIIVTARGGLFLQGGAARSDR
jgi:hypothetical protein